MADKFWVDDRLDDLLRLSPDKLSKKYNITPMYAKTQKYRVTSRIKKRIELMEKDPNYEPTPEHKDEMERLVEILKDFEAHGIPVSEQDATSIERFNIWQTAKRGEDGEWDVQTLRGVQMRPTTADLEADIIREAPPVIIRPAKVTRSVTKDKRAVIVPDLQGGHRRHGDDLETIHDESVVNVGLQIIRHAQPDLIVLNGDNLDFPDLSHFPPDSNHFQQVMQATVDRVHEILAQMRASSPDSKIVWLAGNHEHRLNKQILQHNAALWGIKRAGHKDIHSWLSVANLMNLEELEVDYISGYPANAYQINGRLQAIHGHKVRSNGSTAAMYAKDEELSTIFGHVHRFEQHTRTNRLGRTVTALSFGTWARIDGAVPSYGNGVDDSGNVVGRYENWQNGMGVVEYQDGDKPFTWQTIPIDHKENYETHFDGKRFKPN